MKKGLFISEKPSVKELVKKIFTMHRSEFSFDLDFATQSGHLVTLMKPDEIDEKLKVWSWDTLPILAEEHGGYKYKVIPSSKENYYNIKNMLSTGIYDFVVHAGDSDQEGELLVRLVLNSLNCRLPVMRYWENGQTEKSVLNSLHNMRPDSDPMFTNFYRAALIRQHSDYDLGINGSRALGLKMNVKGMAVGRVKAAILSMVVKRDNDIANFIPHTSYQVVTTYNKGFSGTLFEKIKSAASPDKKAEIKEEIVRFDTKEEALAVINKLSDRAVVKEHTIKEGRQYAPQLYHLATLQVDANRLYSISPDKTLEIAQSLYEKHILSYPRTDCPYLAEDMDFRKMLSRVKCVPSLSGYVDKIPDSAIETVTKSKKWVDTEKMKKAGHFALSPEEPFNFNSLSSSEQKIVELVFKRFLSIFMPPLRLENTQIITENRGYTFKTNGKRILDRGYTILYELAGKETFLPEITNGEVLLVQKNDAVPVTTTPPKSFTQGTLIDAMNNPFKFLENKDEKYKKLGDDLRIGRVSTQSIIIKELIYDKKYLEEKNGIIHASELGHKIVEALKGSFLIKVDETAIWEEEMARIKRGELDYHIMEERNRQAVKDFVQFIKNADIQPAANPSSAGIHKIVIMKCPRCGKDIVENKIRYACVGWKDKSCNYGIYKTYLDANLTAKDALNLLSGKTIIKTVKTNEGKKKTRLRYNSDENRIVWVKQ